MQLLLQNGGQMVVEAEAGGRGCQSLGLLARHWYSGGGDGLRHSSSDD